MDEEVVTTPDWVPDDIASECTGCLRPFTVTFRRHHCRGCGKVYCGDCSSKRCLLPPAFGFKNGPERVCDKCAKEFFPFEPLTVITSTLGNTIEFGRVGTGEQIVVSIHGSYGCYSQGLILASSFIDTSEKRRQYSVISVSRPGYGSTPVESGNSFVAQASMIDSLLIELGLRNKRVILIANGAGGPAAIYFAINHPSRVCGLILVACITRAYWSGQAKGLSLEDVENQSLFSRLTQNGSFQNAGIWLLKKIICSYPNGTRSALRSILANVSLSEPEVIEAQVERILESAELVWMLQSYYLSYGGTAGFAIDSEELKNLPEIDFESVKAPTLIIHGRNDGGVPLTHSEYAASKIADCKLVSLEGTDHLIWLGEKRSEVKEALLEFANRVADSSGAIEHLQHPAALPVLPDPFAGQDERSSGSLIGSKLHKKQVSKANQRNENLVDNLFDL